MKNSLTRSQDTTEAAIEHTEFIEFGLSRLLRKPGVHEALSTLLARHPLTGHAQNPLGEQLLLRAVRVLHERGWHRDWHAFWTYRTGKSWREWKNFPNRMRKMAKELHRMHYSGFFGRYFTPQAERLSTGLRDHADWLESHIGSMGKPKAGQAIGGRNDLVVDLSFRVKAITGHFCDPEVAKLLDAVDVAQNGEKAKMRFSAETNQKLVESGNDRPGSQPLEANSP